VPTADSSLRFRGSPAHVSAVHEPPRKSTNQTEGMHTMRTLLKSMAISACVLAVPLATPLAAQEQANPISTALKNELKGAEQNLTAAAEAMPADKYGYKPTPAQMSFGQLVLHVAGSNDFMCATISGTKAPARAKLDATSAKDALVARLKESFEYCSTALGPMDDSKLSDEVPYFGGRKTSRGGAMMGLAGDWADHYGASAIYLRLNGILPPTAKGAMKM
jgi:hypothetical protein